MAYSTQASIESRFGTANVARWSQLDATSTTADTARIALAIAWADEQIDNRFRKSKYTLPFSAVPATVTDWSSKLAGVWLYTSRGVNAKSSGEESDRIAWHQKAAMGEMDFYLSGQREFADTTARSTRGGSAPFVAGVTNQYGYDGSTQ